MKLSEPPTKTEWEQFLQVIDAPEITRWTRLKRWWARLWQ